MKLIWDIDYEKTVDRKEIQTDWAKTKIIDSHFPAKLSQIWYKAILWGICKNQNNFVLTKLRIY